MTKTTADILIIGSGMAGLSAALYSARYELSTVVIGHEFGGATSTAWTVENYPGFKAIDGYELMTKTKEQVEALGVKVITDKVIDLKRVGTQFAVQTEEGREIITKAVIFATGSARRKLGLSKEDEFSQGKGVHYCTTCDGPLYRGKVIGIVGGGDASIKGANLASQYATKIYIFVRGNQLKAEPINYERLKPHLGEKVEILFGVEVKELLGQNRLEGVKLSNGKELPLDGLFIEIGAVPQVELARGIGVELDQYGSVKVNNMMETNVPGVMAAGDVTNFFGHFKQDITAAAMGSVAATSAFNYIQSRAATESAQAKETAKTVSPR